MLEHGHGLLVVGVEAGDERLRGVVAALHERLAGLVVLHPLRLVLFLVQILPAELGQRLGRVELDVVGPAGGLVHPPAADALGEHRVGNRELDHPGHRLARLGELLVEHLGLRESPGEAVEDEAVHAVLLLDAIGDDADDDLVRDQSAGIHRGLGLLPNLSARGDRSAEHVAGGKLRDAQLVDDLRGVRSFTRPRGAE